MGGSKGERGAQAGQLPETGNLNVHYIGLWTALVEYELLFQFAIFLLLAVENARNLVAPDVHNSSGPLMSL